MALDMVFRFLGEFPPSEALFLFDEPLSRSGELAALYRGRLAGARISGEAKTAPVPEREFPYADCVVASSDRAVIDASFHWMDLACRIIERFGSPRITADFSGIVISGSAAGKLPEGDGFFWRE